MIELNRNQSPATMRGDVEGLRRRVVSRREQFRQQRLSLGFARGRTAAAFASPGSWLTTLPSRYLLHTVVALTVPLALILSQLPTRPVTPDVAPAPVLLEAPIGVGPIELGDLQSATAPIVGDPPLDDELLPLPLSLSSRSELLAPLTAAATIAGDVVKLRNGPGLAYDEVARLNSGDAVQVIGRHDEWLQVRRDGQDAAFWIAAELVNIDDTVVLNLNQVPAELIPPPPPPRIGVVREANVNLRDGPGTNYVTMAKMGQGQELTLVQRFEGWFLVQYGASYGWVTQDFLNLAPGVVERVPVAQSIPDPNPALVGAVAENNVNLRKGPGSAYERVAALDAGTNLTLLARHKDWFRVQTANGTKAWIFSELLNVEPMAVRRVPVTNDIPALPTRPRAVRQAVGGGGGQAPISVPASGDVAGFAAQFVGYRYRWGGTTPAGFDCSGFTTYVYRQFGVSLPRTAASQYSSRVGAIIGSMNNLAPGDLMFFATRRGRGISHVAIYLGGGRMIHAMTPRLGVQVSGIWENYWQATYVGAVRPYR